MKGISTIVALVLVLMITVVLAGGFMLWSSRLTSELQTGAGESIKTTQSALYSIPRIDHVSGQKVFLRNGGTTALSSDTLSVFLDGRSPSFTSSFSTLSPGQIGELTVTNLWEFGSGSKELKVNSGGAFDAKNIIVEPSPGNVLYLPLDENGGTDGSNLPKNNGFETYTTSPGVPDEWTRSGAITDDGANGVTRIKETSVMHGGSSAFKVTVNWASAPFNTINGLKQIISGLQAGKSYVYEVWVYVVQNNGVIDTLVTKHRNLNDNVDFEFKQSNSWTMTGVWQKVNGTFFVDDGNTYEIEIGAYRTAGTTGTDIFIYDDFVVQEIQAKDSAGSNHATLKTTTVNLKGPTIGSEGPVGTVYKFDANDYVVKNPFSAPTGDITIAFWARADSLAASGRHLYSYTIGGGNDLLMAIATGSIGVHYGNVVVVTASVTSTTSVWYHFVVTRKDSTGEVILYRAGSSLGSAIGPISDIASGGAFVLAQDQDALEGGFDSTQAWLGYLDEFVVFDEVYTPQEMYVMELA